jgi:dynein heavy chain 1
MNMQFIFLKGHLLLIGVSGAGKTTLSRFVAWLNGLTVFQVKVHNKYTMNDFDEDLKNVLKRSGCKREKIAFIVDESKVFDSSFLERMNTLLANGEVPGLFEGEEYVALMNLCKESTQKQGLKLDSNDDLYKWFTSQVMKNLHIVFTMNPSDDGLKGKTSTSPALFNRCVLNWFGDWSQSAYYQVSKEFTSHIDMKYENFKISQSFENSYENSSAQEVTSREVVLSSFVFIHQSLHQTNNLLSKRNRKTVPITPRHYLDFVAHFVSLYKEKKCDIEEQQQHINNGLNKIKETLTQVEELQISLSGKRQELEMKNSQASVKLKQMIIDQQEAEKTKMDSQELQKVLEVQTNDIATKSDSVMSQLSKVEPALKEAQQGLPLV